MKVLIVGSGGREHAIAASAAKSSKVEKMYCAPGNAGIEEFAECVPIGAMEFEKLVAFAKEKSIDLCIVGMDDPLVGGLVDEMEAAGIRTFGPRKNAAHHLIILFMISQILSSGRLMDKIPDVKGCAVMIPRPIRWEIVFRLRPLPVGPPDHTATVGKTPRRPIPLSTVSAVHRPGLPGHHKRGGLLLRPGHPLR